MWALLHRNTVQDVSENIPNIDEIEPIEALRDDFSIVYFDPLDETIEVGMDMDPSNTTFAYPSTLSVPIKVKPAQAKLALAQFGLLSQVEAIINDPNTDITIKIAWTDASEFRRDNSLIAQLGSLLGLTSEEIDTLFIVADSIQLT